MNFATIDFVVLAAYASVILGVGLYVSRNKTGHEKNTQDYFLAGKSLPWWAVGASLIAANISAEQFIGMSGSGFAIGLAIASYEWMAALTLIIVGKFFLPIFIEKKLYTIPEFVEVRFGTTLKTILAIFWIALFVFVNLTTVLYLGAKSIDTIVGTGSGSLLMTAIIALAVFSAAYSLWGGLSAVAWTDVIQVILLVLGGLITTVIALNHVTETGGILNGFRHIYETVPEKFSMILEKGDIIYPNGGDAWWDLPGIGVLIGGLWVANLYYWGFNQYIIQRTLAAKNLKESQRGIIFAGFLKLIIPLIVVVPGIIAYVLNADPGGNLTQESLDPSFVGSDGTILNDNAAPWLINAFVPAGLKGLVLAALSAAIVSSLASMLNSTSTIFTMDIYRPYFNPGASEKVLVRTGRLTVVVALVIAVLLAPQLSSLGQVFQFIQEYTGVVSPGILAVFLMGLFVRKANNAGAIVGVILSIPIAMYFKIGSKGWADGFLFIKLPWMTQMLWTCLATMAVIFLVSLLTGKGQVDEKGIVLNRRLFITDPVFNICAFSICLILVALYAMFW